MQNRLKAKDGFAILLVVLLVAAGLLFASVVFKNFSKGTNSVIDNITGVKNPGVSAIQSLSKTDSVSDIQSDLESTNFDDIDRDLSQASSDLSGN